MQATVKKKDFRMNRRFPMVRQRDAMQCGAACLTMVARHFGSRRGLEEVSALCHPTTEGVSLKGIGNLVSLPISVKDMVYTKCPLSVTGI